VEVTRHVCVCEDPRSSVSRREPTRKTKLGPVHGLSMRLRFWEARPFTHDLQQFYIMLWRSRRPPSDRDRPPERAGPIKWKWRWTCKPLPKMRK